MSGDRGEADRALERVEVRKAWARREVPVSTLNLPAVDYGRAAERHARRWAYVALPDATIIELNAQAIGRKDGALVARIDPDSAVGRAPVGPSPVGLARFRREVHGFPFCVTKVGAPSMPFRHNWMHR